jgi:uncharacterized repeat protein (TIGR01451 family)
MIGDLRLGSESSFPSNLTKLNDEILFSADNGTYGYELWATYLHSDLYVHKSVDPAMAVAPGTPITYMLMFNNASDNLYTNIVLVDALPAYLTNIHYTSSGAVITETGSVPYTWLVEDLAPGDGGIVTISGVLSSNLSGGLIITNTAIITTTGVETNTADNTSSAVVVVASVAPAAVADVASTEEDALAMIDVLGNDADLNGDPLFIGTLASPSHGAASISGTVVLYTPTLDFNGIDLFTYTVSDGFLTDTATVSITVTPVNDLPVAEAGSDQTVSEGAPLQFTGIVTDVDSTTHAILWTFGDGTILTGTFTPSHTYADDGIYPVTLVVTDTEGGVGSDTTAVTVTNVTPVLVNVPADLSVTVNQPFSFTVTFTDPGLLDTFSILIEWETGITETFELDAGASSFSASHTYGLAGDYTVIFYIADDGGIISGKFWVIVTEHMLYLPIVTR